MRRQWLIKIVSQSFALDLFFAFLSYLLSQLEPAFNTLFLAAMIILLWLGVAGVLILLDVLTDERER